jgi:hypothetical protein
LKLSSGLEAAAGAVIPDRDTRLGGMTSKEIHLKPFASSGSEALSYLEVAYWPRLRAMGREYVNGEKRTGGLPDFTDHIIIEKALEELPFVSDGPFHGHGSPTCSDCKRVTEISDNSQNHPA